MSSSTSSICFSKRIVFERIIYRGKRHHQSASVHQKNCIYLKMFCVSLDKGRMSALIFTFSLRGLTVCEGVWMEEIHLRQGGRAGLWWHGARPSLRGGGGGGCFCRLCRILFALWLWWWNLPQGEDSGAYSEHFHPLMHASWLCSGRLVWSLEKKKHYTDKM